MQWTRRALLGAAAAAAPLAPAVSAQSRAATPTIDCHSHLSHHGRADWSEMDRKLVEAADKLGIDEMVCSILTPTRPSTPEGFRQCNDWVAEAMRRFPGRVRGYCYVNPGWGKVALDEIRRCIVRLGFTGVKLYNEYTANELVVAPLFELAIELGIPVLHHAGHTTWLPQPQPRISDGSHFAEVARKYPEAAIICAHICGGGDWEWQIKALRNAPTVYLDTAGSVTDEGVVEMAHRILGPDRLLFACDMSLTASVGRMRGAAIPEADKAKIRGGNFQKVLARRRV